MIMGILFWYLIGCALVVAGIVCAWPREVKIIEGESLEVRKQKVWEESLYEDE